MKPLYEHPSGARIIGTQMGDQLYYIGDLWVPPTERRKHIATQLMRMICNEADREQVNLGLTALPADDTMSQEILMLFYERFGFRRMAIKIKLMMRTPV